MSGIFKWLPFNQCNFLDPFFDSLKEDYQEFPQWFKKKSDAGEQALVCFEGKEIQAFLYMKSENEEIQLAQSLLPVTNRIKIGTLKMSNKIQGKRYGEGAIGVALWEWQESNAEEIYVTVFDKHEQLVQMLKKFGFSSKGLNNRGEQVFVKNKKSLSPESPYSMFPYLDGNFKKAGYIPIEDHFHDTLFPYSELKGTRQESLEIAAANGITKVFIACPKNELHIDTKEPVLIYRKFSGENKGFKSAVTSYCSITEKTVVKKGAVASMSFEEFQKLVGNKTVYNLDELRVIYKQKRNIIVLEMVYNGFFGAGRNVNFRTLKDNGFFEDYPYEIKLSRADFNSILEMGGKNVQNIIVD